MSTYKVLQDVEAEDKLIGPLSLRQFIYAGIAAISLYLCYTLATHHAGFLIIVFFPIAAVAAFFAFPWGRDQPTELWALAKIRFLVKPRRRIWDQSGVKELVTITAPKHVQVDYTNGLSPTEVQSRLHALATTIDSRGWAIKNANLNLYSQQSLNIIEPQSDRLIGPSALPQPVSNVEVSASDDILDEKNNPAAQRVDTMISASTKAHREKIMESLRKPAPPPQQPANDYWFLNQPAQSSNIPNNMVTFNTQVVTPGANQSLAQAPASAQASDASEPDEASIVAELDAHRQTLPTTAYYTHLHTIQPLSAQAAGPGQVAQPAAQQTAAPVANQPTAPISPSPGPLAPPVAPQAPPSVTPTQQAAILQLSRNDDLNVATIAREAERATPQDEVVIKLH